MTVFYPDVSSFQAGLSLSGAPAAMAKATEGTTYRDSQYAGFKAQAATLGIPFSGYHFLRQGDIGGQAAYAHGIVGTTPLMLDVETAGDGSWPSLPEVFAFIDAYRAGGGVCTTAYIPHWFWQGNWGSPNMTGLTDRHVGLISSNYISYSDNGPGWAPYGGVTPVIWQYSSAYPFNGYAVDMNAFKGSVAELAALFNGGDMTPEEHNLLASNANRIQHGILDGDDTMNDTPGYNTVRPIWIVGAIKQLNAKLDQVIAALAAGGAPSGPVTVSDASVAAIADAVADEEAARLAE